MDCYATDIVARLKDCDALLWHHNQGSPKDILFAKQLLFSLEQAGKKVFPDFKTGWHFDDKLGQKYLLEACGVEAVPAHAFFSKKEALEWAGKTVFPKVFKLRGGAGSSNVSLVKNKSAAVSIINQAFGKGFAQYPPLANLKERVRKYRIGKTTFFDVLKGVVRLAMPPQSSVVAGRERGYVYFQDFIPGNDHDIRVVIIGNKAFAIKRMVRKNDFRASGSGNILYAKELFDEKLIARSFEINRKLQSQCLALDFVFIDNKPLVVEISFGFAMGGYDACPGYWDEKLNWYEGAFVPQNWMIDLLVNQ